MLRTPRARRSGPGKQGFPRTMYLPYTALTTISLMLENIIGLDISLPRKTVDWTIPTLEAMGIGDLALKRNLIIDPQREKQPGMGSAPGEREAVLPHHRFVRRPQQDAAHPVGQVLAAGGQAVGLPRPVKTRCGP